jgi:subfamily B ATP-binding cassette protein HlyB/CyaB
MIASVPPAFIFEILLAAFCVDILTLAIPVFSQLILDKVVVHNSYNTLHVIGAGVVIAIVFESLLGFTLSRHIHYLSANVDDFLMRPAMRKLMALPLAYFDQRPKGEVMQDLREVHTIRNFLTTASITSVVDLVFMMLVLLLIAAYSPRLAVIVGMSVPLFALVSACLRPGVQRRYKTLNDRNGSFESVLAEGLEGIATLKMMAMEPLWATRLANAHDSYVKAGLEAKKTGILEDTLIRFVQRALTLAVLWAGAVEVLANRLTLGQLLACYMFALRVLVPSARIFQVITGLARIQDSKKRLDDLLVQAEEGNAPRSPGLAFQNGAIRFEGVNFRYDYGGPMVLSDISLRLEEGTSLGIVGASGSGKSTLARLLQRHLAPTAGHITIGDVDLRDFDLADLRRNIGLVQHDAAIFKGTVRENILGRREAAAESEVWDMCRLVEAEEFVLSLPQGLDTPLDERATQLSSGQRQRIALARALLAKPAVLLLDEATNGLDAETEALVLDKIRQGYPDLTLVVITHREYLLAHAERTMRISQGRVALTDAPALS